jgi:hypothetical protein
VKVLPQYRDEILHAALENKLPTRAEEGVEAYYQTARKDDPNSILFSRSFHHKPRTIRMFKPSTRRGPSQLFRASLRRSQFALS